MLEGVLSSLIGKILAVVTGLAAVGGGMAGAGLIPGIPGLGGTPEATAEVGTPAGSASVSTSNLLIGLDNLPVGSDAADALALVGQAQASADAAKAAAATCLATANTQISGLVAKLAGVTNPAQAQALLGTAGTIGTEAQKCADEAKALAKTSVDQATAASQAAGLLGVAGLGDLSGVGNPDDLLAQIMAAVEDAGRAAAEAETMALGIVNSVITSVGTMLPIPGGEGGLPLPLPGGEGGLPLPVPGVGEGGLPLPIPGVGEGGLPLPGAGDPTELVGQLAGTILGALGGVGGGGLPVPVPGL